MLPRVAASQFPPVAAFHSAGLFFLATGSTGLTCGTGRAGVWAVGFEGVASGTGCAGVNVMGSRGCTGVLLADSWAGCAPHPTISMVTIAVMITSFTAGQRLSRRWRSSRFSLCGGCRGKNDFSAWTLLDLVDLARLDGAMFTGASVGGFDQGHGLEIVAPADGRFPTSLECDEELGHGADEGVREPALVPSR